MSTFEHKGQTITLLSNGKFQAEINGRNVTAASLDGVKKQIDNAAKTQFKPFKALVRQGWDADPREVTIVGVKPPRKNAWRAQHEFIDSNGREYTDIIPDTPENRAALVEYRAWIAESRHIEKQRQEIAYDLDKKITRLDADDFAPSKPKPNGTGE